MASIVRQQFLRETMDGVVSASEYTDIATRFFKTADGAVSAIEFLNPGNDRVSHRHADAQLLLVMRGLISCEVSTGLWMVPPQCAIWIPAGMEHSARGVGANLQIFSLYIRPKLVDRLPHECCTLTISPLLRELVIETSHLSSDYDVDGPDGQLVEIMLDRLALSQVEQLHLPMPSDRRLRKIAEDLLANPSDRRRLPELAQTVGMSERTLCRLLIKETGMNFVRWRQQFQIMFALQCLSQGDCIQRVAFNLGFKSSSAFVTMFRKTLGKPPLKYLADRSPGAVSRSGAPLQSLEAPRAPV